MLLDRAAAIEAELLSEWQQCSLLRRFGMRRPVTPKSPAAVASSLSYRAVEFAVR
jgi:hypothetical protein